MIVFASNIITSIKGHCSNVTYNETCESRYELFERIKVFYGNMDSYPVKCVCRQSVHVSYLLNTPPYIHRTTDGKVEGLLRGKINELNTHT